MAQLEKTRKPTWSWEALLAFAHKVHDLQQFGGQQWGCSPLLWWFNRGMIVTTLKKGTAKCGNTNCCCCWKFGFNKHDSIYRIFLDGIMVNWLFYLSIGGLLYRRQWRNHHIFWLMVLWGRCPLMSRCTCTLYGWIFASLNWWTKSALYIYICNYMCIYIYVCVYIYTYTCYVFGGAKCWCNSSA